MTIAPNSERQKNIENITKKKILLRIFAKALFNISCVLQNYKITLSNTFYKITHNRFS